MNTPTKKRKNQIKKEKRAILQKKKLKTKITTQLLNLQMQKD